MNDNLLEEIRGRGWMNHTCGCDDDENITCFKHKLRSIQFAGRGKSPQTQMESQWDRDRPAYLRLRREGLQPKSVKGSAELEQRANSQTEIEMGQFFDKKDLSKVHDAMAACREMEWVPQDSPAAVTAAKERAQKRAPLTDKQKATIEKHRVR